jgi:biopolymer transport protein ExbB
MNAPFFAPQRFADPAAALDRVREIHASGVAHLRDALHRGLAHLQFGQVLLASIGATAPFVGLFGTVWGIYHALLGIAASGAIAIEKVAGPVGEALIMTAFGLAVAIPAVLAYNAFVRVNRTLLAQLDGFAHDLHAYVTVGERPA